MMIIVVEIPHVGEVEARWVMKDRSHGMMDHKMIHGLPDQIVHTGNMARAMPDRSQIN